LLFGGIVVFLPLIQRPAQEVDVDLVVLLGRKNLSRVNLFGGFFPAP
jgi:hypothetical protein